MTTCVREHPSHVITNVDTPKRSSCANLGSDMHPLAVCASHASANAVLKSCAHNAESPNVVTRLTKCGHQHTPPVYRSVVETP
eukprot:8164347-Pyramimonas_sp.AAC.1